MAPTGTGPIDAGTAAGECLSASSAETAGETPLEPTYWLRSVSSALGSLAGRVFSDWHRTAWYPYIQPPESRAKTELSVAIGILAQTCSSQPTAIAAMALNRKYAALPDLVSQTQRTAVAPANRDSRTLLQTFTKPPTSQTIIPLFL